MLVKVVPGIQQDTVKSNMIFTWAALLQKVKLNYFIDIFAQISETTHVVMLDPPLQMHL